MQSRRFAAQVAVLVDASAGWRGVKSLAAPHVYSLMQGNPSPRRYRALNVLEELDQPGEFVIDRKAGRLYLWPPANLKGALITLAALDAPVVALDDASYITLRGFVVDSGLENGVEVRNGTACELVACEVRNLRRFGIRVTGGAKHRVVSCDIHHTGQGGLVLGGGDRKGARPGVSCAPGIRRPVRHIGFGQDSR